MLQFVGEALPKSTAPATEPFSQRFMSKIGHAIDNLTYIDTITLIADPKTTKWDYDAESIMDEISKLNDVYLVGRTVIELDGDIVSILPGNTTTGEVSVNQDLLEYHKANVKEAVANWNNFIHEMLSVTEIVLSLVGLEKGSDTVEKYLGGTKVS